MRVRLFEFETLEAYDRATGEYICTLGSLSVQSFRINPDAVIKSEPNTLLRRILEDIERIRRVQNET